MLLPRSVYLHVPFCRHRCGYCNFSLVSGRDHLIEKYLQALELEIQQQHRATIKTLFIGGGTPTHLSIKQLNQLFDLIENQFEYEPEMEFSIEANPSDINRELVEFLGSRGVNRISLGVQSFQAKKLRDLERDHDEATVKLAADLILENIPNLSIDLIIGSRDETMTDWESDLSTCLACRPNHVSTYSLTIEKGTQFWNRQNHNELMQVEEELAVEMYERSIEVLENGGFKHYEVSNFAQAGFECSHNINYWNGGEYFGFGPGAARFVNRTRATNHQSPSRYIQLLLNGKDPTVESELIDDEQHAREILIFGLRQIAGIDLEQFERETGRDPFKWLGPIVSNLVDQGLLSVKEQRLKLTRKGLLVSDSIWPSLL